MKKLSLLGMLFAATICNAQVVLWNGDDKELNSDGGFWNRADPTVVEDDGNKCLKVTLRGNPGGWDQEHHNAALPIGDADIKGLRRVTFRLKMADKHNVMVQLEGKDGAYNAKRIFWYDTPNEWQVMVYEFALGPESEKITETGSNVLAIWPYEETAEGEGKTVYIDDIKVEGPMVNDRAVRALPDNSLTGEVVVTGVIGKGTYQNTWSGDWHTEAYDDWALLAAKLAPTATKLDISGAGRWDEDLNVIKAKCPNIVIVTETTGIQTVKQNSSLNGKKGERYSVFGVRMNGNAQNGLYIQDGKKYFGK
jgi:hypothetical protein